MGYERGVKKGPLWEVFELLKAGYTVVFPLEERRTCGGWWRPANASKPR